MVSLRKWVWYGTHCVVHGTQMPAQHIRYTILIAKCIYAGINPSNESTVTGTDIYQNLSDYCSLYRDYM
jgi:hypothetical protein